MRNWWFMFMCKAFALNCAYWANEPKPLGLDVVNGIVGVVALRTGLLMIGVALWTINEQLLAKEPKKQQLCVNRIGMK
jgi:hypothetical protein